MLVFGSSVIYWYSFKSILGGSAGWGVGLGGRTGEWLLSLLRDDDAALHHCTAFTGSAGQSKAQSTNRLEPQRIVGTVVLQVNVCVVMKKRTEDWRAVKGSSCVLHRGGGGGDFLGQFLCVAAARGSAAVFSVRGLIVDSQSEGHGVMPPVSALKLS